MPSKRVCITCGSDNTIISDYLVEQKYPLCHCQNCGLSFLELSGEDNTDVSFDDYWGEVNEVIYTHPKTVEELRKKYNNYFDQISDPPNRKFLDVGSGAGICVNAAQSYGFDAMGVEPSERGVQLSRKNYSINVSCDLLRADDDLPRDFGVLTLWDVIEHVHDPEELVSNCALHLVGGGFLILETPDEGAFIRSVIRRLSTFARAFDLRGNMYYRAHRYYFTTNAMKKLLERCGFDEIQLYRERTMYEKALLKARLYGGVTGGKALMLKSIFWLLKRLPLLQNKMVVVARKSV